MFLLGAGSTILAGGVRLFNVIVSCRPCLFALALLAAYIAGDIRRHHIDSVRCTARIAADHKASDERAKARDASVAADLEQRYRPQIDALQAEASKLRNQVQADDSKIIAKIINGRCQLGAAALRLRTRAR